MHEPTDRKRIITVAGKPGSGKSTTSNLVAAHLNYKRYSAGSVMRNLASERGVTLDAINTMAENDPTIDKTVDEALKQYADEDRIVIDARLAWKWIPDSFKVYLDLHPDVAAKRIHGSKDMERFSTEEVAENVVAYSNQIATRFDSEKFRFDKYYSVDPFDKAHFDLVLDTSLSDAESVARQVWSAYEEWLLGRSTY